ncbi:MAG: hypothetical protein HC842_04855 [Cytophagales bacterium]|nr:hypothetical protein [Cytophagales bacterium]
MTQERNALFGFLTRNKISGVFLLSSDRHRADVWKITRPDDYPLVEFASGRLTNTHYHKAMPGVEFSYNRRPVFGMLHFDFGTSNSVVTYEIINIDNKSIYTYPLTLKQLR